MLALLEVDDLFAGYGSIRVLNGVSLQVEPGSITALLGSNGAGKTTLMRTIVGLIQAHEETEPRYRHGGIDIVLTESGQGRGFGTDAVRTVARWLIGERGHHRLTIDPAADNERAIRAYSRVGFRPVGIMRRYEGDLDGTWHDGLLMDLLRRELA